MRFPALSKDRSPVGRPHVRPVAIVLRFLWLAVDFVLGFVPGVGYERRRLDGRGLHRAVRQWLLRGAAAVERGPPPQDRKGARPHCSPIDIASRQQSDRVVVMFALGQKRTSLNEMVDVRFWLAMPAVSRGSRWIPRSLQRSPLAPARLRRVLR